jgi:hypothetical protein
MRGLLFLSVAHAGVLRWIPINTSRGQNKFKSLNAVTAFVEIMPSVARRKAKNTQNAQQKKLQREKEAKKKLERQQLPAKGKKR